MSLRVQRGIDTALAGARAALDRLTPADACLPIASYDVHVIVVCNEGYASSLAAAALQRLGLSHATDLIGGYRAWRAAGLPTSGFSPSASVQSSSAVDHGSRARAAGT